MKKYDEIWNEWEEAVAEFDETSKNFEKYVEERLEVYEWIELDNEVKEEMAKIEEASRKFREEFIKAFY